MTPESLLTIPQVAEHLQVSDKWVRARIADGSLRATRLGKHWRVMPDVLQQFVLDSTPPTVVVALRRRRSPTHR